MSENSTLCIHTQFRPEEENDAQSAERRKAFSLRALARRRPRPRASNRANDFRRNPAPSGEPRDGFARPPIAPISKKPAAPLTRSDRLLRNSAIACAALLGVLALGNLNEPWAVKARDGIQKALTMRIDLDDSLGELTFVRSLMPESALVFLNVTGGGAMLSPTDGTISHGWSALQPWTMFEGGGAVRSAGAGTVTAVSPLSDGLLGVLVDHGEGLESVYANLASVAVNAGDAINRGDALGTCDGNLYFELRQGGNSIDPAEKLGL